MALSGSQKTRVAAGGAGASYLGFVAKETSLGVVGYLTTSLSSATALTSSFSISGVMASSLRILE